MNVDLVRNDLGLICSVGSITVPKLTDAENYSNVHQMTSTMSSKIITSSLSSLNILK